tara:strand:+ start:32493 stop:33215 length:723 start_codon:yes stop_codon:yes gene_type:complete
MRPDRQHGAGAIEFAVVFLIFAALMTGLFEMTRVYRTKHTLNTATFLAARAGAVNHARTGPIEAELANNMATLYTLGQRDSTGLSQAVARAKTLTALPGIGAELVSPSREIFDRLQRLQWIRRTGEEDYRWQNVIPNDNLKYRPRTLAHFSSDSGSGQINLQDANLLKIRSLWCHRLVVPGLDRLIFQIVNQPAFVSARQLVCSAISGLEQDGIAPGFYLPVAADATVRMQSAIVSDDLP